MKQVFTFTSRIALAACIVGGIGWGFVALNPPDEKGEIAVGIQESHADIFSMSFAARTSTQKFQASLDKLGHEKPRVYDMNGNTVMFSTNQMRGNIDQVLQRYMRMFADEELNPHVFQRDTEPDSEDGKAMIDASVHGGVIPWIVRDDYLAMGGAVLDVDMPTRDKVDQHVRANITKLQELLDRFDQAYAACGGDPEEWKAALRDPRPTLVNPSKVNNQSTLQNLCSGSADGGLCDDTLYRKQQLEHRHKAVIHVVENNPELRECGPIRDAITSFTATSYDDYTDKIKAFRSIEAWYNKTTGATKITATWSDESFDARKAQPSRYGGVIENAAAQKVPLCPGCRRTWAFQGTGSERAYSSNIIVSPSDPVRTANFYRTELQKEGWQIPESQLVFDEIQRMGGKQSHDSEWIRMRRGNEFLALHISRDDDGRTKVRTSTAP